MDTQQTKSLSLENKLKEIIDNAEDNLKEKILRWTNIDESSLAVERDFPESTFRYFPIRSEDIFNKYKNIDNIHSQCDYSTTSKGRENDVNALKIEKKII